MPITLNTYDRSQFGLLKYMKNSMEIYQGSKQSNNDKNSSFQFSNELT